MPVGESRSDLERVQLENETLSGVVGVVASGPDLAHILDRVVDLLTRATSCHACFVYLRSGEEIHLRAASPVYSHLVGKISFDADDGLTGWTMKHRKPAFIRDDASADPRTNYVEELEEERFQSMVAVPIPSRSEGSIGSIVLHSVAPREFDEGILNVLSRTASLVAGAIENARLYEQANARVTSLTRLSKLGRDIAAVSNREALYVVATEGMIDLLGTDLCRIYEFEPDGRLRRVAANPSEEAGPATDEETATLLDLAEGGLPDDSKLQKTLGLKLSPAVAKVVTLSAGVNRLGVLLTAADREWTDVGSELLSMSAQQIALALEKIELIERLTEENFARDLFDALGAGELDTASARARTGGVDVNEPYVAVEVRARGRALDHPLMQEAETVEQAVRRGTPGTICDLHPSSLRALIPATTTGDEAARRITARLVEVAKSHDLAIGASDARAGASGLSDGLREAADAATVATALLDHGDVMHYRDTSVYRYLIDLLEDGGPRDYLTAPVDRLVDYDKRRRSELLPTLDEYLTQGRGAAATARALTIHVNTLRQRLQRIEALTGLSLADEDLLALHLAVKLARVRRLR